MSSIRAVAAIDIALGGGRFWHHNGAQNEECCDGDEHFHV
jgi:hypothetical protein